jgi:hypothetical protein
MICFILVRHTNNIIKSQTVPSSVTVKIFLISTTKTTECHEHPQDDIKEPSSQEQQGGTGSTPIKRSHKKEDVNLLGL